MRWKLREEGKEMKVGGLLIGSSLARFVLNDVSSPKFLPIRGR